MRHFHHRFHLPRLARLLTVAGVSLTVASFVGIAQGRPDGAAFAQSAANSTVDTVSQAALPQSETGSSTAAGTATPTPSATPSSPSTAPGAEKPGTAANQAAPAGKKPAVTTPSVTPIPATAITPSGTWKYPLHTGIKTTYFWAGEEAGPDNDFIQNLSSAWQTDWKSHFGGTDDPEKRCVYNPCAFTPKENPFYFALPFSDFTETGPVADLSMVHWYDSTSRSKLNSGQSILKNRWIQITAAPNGVSKTVYAQWQDVGPFVEHDTQYVFGTSKPTSTRAGLDVSPAVRDYLGMGGSTTSSWRFVDASEVPAGPWKTIVTTSGPDWK